MNVLAAHQLPKYFFLGGHLLLKVLEEIPYYVVLYQHTNVVVRCN